MTFTPIPARTCGYHYDSAVFTRGAGIFRTNMRFVGSAGDMEAALHSNFRTNVRERQRARPVAALAPAGHADCPYWLLNDDVGPRAAVEHIVARAAFEDVVARSAVQGVIACT